MIRSLIVANYHILNGGLNRLCYLEGVLCLEYVITLILYNQRHSMGCCATCYNC